jgi:hypothetical protein
LRRRLLRTAKKPSTALSHDAEVGVRMPKTRTPRVRRESQRGFKCQTLSTSALRRGRPRAPGFGLASLVAKAKLRSAIGSLIGWTRWATQGRPATGDWFSRGPPPAGAHPNPPGGTGASCEARGSGAGVEDPGAGGGPPPPGWITGEVRSRDRPA